MPSAPKSKKSKHHRNISGLWNQGKCTPTPSKHATPPQSQVPSGDDRDLEDDNEELALLIHFDSLKTNLQREEENADELEELEDEEVKEWEGFGSEDLADGMVDMFLADDDPNDLDWMPQRMQTKAEKRRKTKKGEHSPQG